jgi:putative transposase
MAERGIILTYEAVRYWCRRPGQAYANQLCRRRPRPGGEWHPDEALLTSNGARHHRWRAVDQGGYSLASLARRRRDTKAAERFLRKLLKGGPVCRG